MYNWIGKFFSRPDIKIDETDRSYNVKIEMQHTIEKSFRAPSVSRQLDEFLREVKSEAYDELRERVISKIIHEMFLREEVVNDIKESLLDHFNTTEGKSKLENAAREQYIVNFKEYLNTQK